MGMGLAAFTLFHVAISLAGIVSGFVVIEGMLGNRRLDGWTAAFLATTVATSVTGFLFPAERFMPSHAVGIVSLVVLPVVAFARYRRDMAGGWRAAFVVCALLAQYLNVFVLVVQLFQKVPPLRAAAPTQAEPPFVITQALVLLAFVALTVTALVRFRPARRVSPAGIIDPRPAAATV